MASAGELCQSAQRNLMETSPKRHSRSNFNCIENATEITLKLSILLYMHACMHVVIIIYICMHACMSLLLYICMHACRFYYIKRMHNVECKMRNVSLPGTLSAMLHSQHSTYFQVDGIESTQVQKNVQVSFFTSELSVFAINNSGVHSDQY